MIALAPLAVAACGPDPAEPQAAPANAAAGRPAAPSPTPAQIEEGRAAAETLRLYYEHVAAGDHRAAWALRERRPGLGFEAFAASFSAYEDYRATVGVPSLPVATDGFLWIEVPVQLYGRLRGGASFGSVGRVTMKRPAPEPDGWQIVP